MGVKGLHTYLEGKLPAEKYTVTLAEIADMAFRAGLACTIVVDGMALIRKLYTPDLEWTCGGQYQELYLNVQAFVRTFSAHGLQLVVFLDGGVDDAKLSEWQSRRQKDLQKCQRVADALREGVEAPKAAWMPPPNISKAVGGAFSQHGCDVYYTAGEADRELASYCSSRSCAAVLAKDSDFFVLPVPAYLNLDTLQLHRSPPNVALYRREAVEAAMALPSPLLPLLGSLVGNDFVPTHLLSDFHRALLPGRHASGAPLIEAVAHHVAAASAAAGWTGPWPCTPLLWCSLDWRGHLSAEARALIEQSLEQYAVSESFRELPASLIERASAASSAMLRRFRRGRLDSAVFTSATRLAIWRGPSIDDPDAPPTILASRPLRCETYAACVRPMREAPIHVSTATADGSNAHGAENDEAPVGCPPSAAAGEPDAATAAATAVASDAASDAGGGALCVSEHIIYSAQAEHGAAESVVVPPQLNSCEVMWTLPPHARCACMLRALGRAGRDDASVSGLDPAVIIALGPASLVFLSVRFMRRQGLVPRAIALVILCQGLVMAWLAETRQRLPVEFRRRPRGARGTSLQAAHFASLFTRVSADLSVLNSACGEPLLLHGPWEWFDAVLFESMFISASKASAEALAARGASSCWAALLRGDANLLAVFELLRPLALAESSPPMKDQPGRASQADDLARVLPTWTEATQQGAQGQTKR